MIKLTKKQRRALRVLPGRNIRLNKPSRRLTQPKRAGHHGWRTR